MNCCRETTKMGVPPGNRPAYRGIGSEAYLNGTSQGPAPEDARKDGHIIRARYAPLSPASGFPVSWSQQVMHEISGLDKGVFPDHLAERGKQRDKSRARLRD
jgi:hypothetical protein